MWAWDGVRQRPSTLDDGEKNHHCKQLPRRCWRGRRRRGGQPLVAPDSRRLRPLAVVDAPAVEPTQ